MAVVAATEVETEGLGALVQYLAEYLYTENRLVESTQPERLQRASDILKDLFVQVSLWKNTQKTLSMAC